MENDKAKKVSNSFGGMLGNATDALKTRKDKIEEQVDNAEKSTSAAVPLKEGERPAMSKKWYER